MSLTLEATNIESIRPELNVESNQQVVTTELVKGVKLITFHTADRIGEVTVADADPATAQLNPPGETATVQEIVVPENVTEQSATLVFTVSRQRIETLGTSADRLSVVRLTDDGWQLLNTTVTGQTNTTVTLKTETPGFSVFVVTATEEPESTATGTPPVTPAGESVMPNSTESEEQQSTEAGGAVTDTANSSVATETFGESVLGFGPLVALIALVMLTLAAVRRNWDHP